MSDRKFRLPALTLADSLPAETVSGLEQLRDQLVRNERLGRQRRLASLRSKVVRYDRKAKARLEVA